VNFGTGLSPAQEIAAGHTPASHQLSQRASALARGARPAAVAKMDDTAPLPSELAPDEIYVGRGFRTWATSETQHEHFTDQEAAKVAGRRGGLDPERGVVKCETCAFARERPVGEPMTTITVEITADLNVAARQSTAAVGKPAPEFWREVVTAGLQALGVTLADSAERRGARKA
jgi:hypothetical protein